jgi:hypothetical protein
MVISTAELVALQRSTAMVAPGQPVPVERERLHALCTELIEARQLLARLGSDLREVAARSRQNDTTR